MRRILPYLFALLSVSCGSGKTDGPAKKTVAMEQLTDKKNIGNKLVLYPMPLVVVGTEVDGKVNWMLAAHVGIIGHDRILVSLNSGHYTNRGIISSRRLSLNMVDREMLPKADYVGSVSGGATDKSHVFDFRYGANGSPVAEASPLVMECEVVDIYETEGFDNFICSVVNTYADEDILDERGRPDYNRLKPVLFEFPTYSYVAAGEVIGKCLRLDREPSMCAKQPMSDDGIVRLSRVEVRPEYLEEYMKYAAEVGEVSLRTEPGVLTMYAVAEQENSCRITILETYACRTAYERHIASPHFRRYKQATQHMIRSLELVDQKPLNNRSRIVNFMEQP